MRILYVTPSCILSTSCRWKLYVSVSGRNTIVGERSNHTRTELSVLYILIVKIPRAIWGAGSRRALDDLAINGKI